MRARALAWVFTTSSQSTTVLAAALTFFAPRAMLTAGITRETSPARCPAPCGSARMSAGIASSEDSRAASRQTHGDFVFMGTLLKAFWFL